MTNPVRPPKKEKLDEAQEELEQWQKLVRMKRNA